MKYITGSDFIKTHLESQLHILHAKVDADSSSNHDLNSVIAYIHEVIVTSPERLQQYCDTHTWGVILSCQVFRHVAPVVKAQHIRLTATQPPTPNKSD